MKSPLKQQKNAMVMVMVMVRGRIRDRDMVRVSGRVRVRVRVRVWVRVRGRFKYIYIYANIVSSTPLLVLPDDTKMPLFQDKAFISGWLGYVVDEKNLCGLYVGAINVHLYIQAVEDL